MSKNLLLSLTLGALTVSAWTGCQTSDPTSPAGGEAFPTGAGGGEGSIGFRRGTGAVFTMTNATVGNEVIAYRRDSSGELGDESRIATGGLGTGSGLGNQGGVVLSRDQQWLLVVNAASNDVSVFQWNGHDLHLTDVEPSGGTVPISVTIHRNWVYVLNAGVPGNIQGFELSPAGDLKPLAGSQRSLSGDDVGPAQIQFAPDGQALVVTEKATNSIVTYSLSMDGTASDPTVHASNGETPFGFAFTRQGHMIVSEAFGGATDASAVSSYDVTGSTLSTIEASVPTTETAACWVAVTPNGRYAYTTNTGSSSLTGFRIMPSGELEILNADGRTGETTPGSGPIDLVVSRMGHYLYALLAGTNEIGAFAVATDGSLTPLTGVGGLPAGTNGLAGF